MKKILALLLSLTLLASCAVPTTKIEVEASINPLDNITINHPPAPRQLDLRKVQWQILTKELLEDLVNDENFKDKDFAFFIVNADGYENLSLNVQEMKRYIEQQKAIILYYRKTIQEIQEEFKSRKNKKQK